MSVDCVRLYFPFLCNLFSTSVYFHAQQDRLKCKHLDLDLILHCSQHRNIHNPFNQMLPPSQQTRTPCVTHMYSSLSQVEISTIKQSFSLGYKWFSVCTELNWAPQYNKSKLRTSSARQLVGTGVFSLVWHFSQSQCHSGLCCASV